MTATIEPELDDGVDRPSDDTATLRRVVLFALVIAAMLLVRAFLLEPVRVRSDSMAPALSPGAMLIIDKTTYHHREPHRGEIVVTVDPRNGGSIIKRVVAVGGDSIGIEDGVLILNGAPVVEDYIDNENMDGYYFGPDAVPADSVFLLGDNRDTSEDSRAFGPVDVDDVDGRVLVKLWPPG